MHYFTVTSKCAILTLNSAYWNKNVHKRIKLLRMKTQDEVLRVGELYLSTQPTPLLWSRMDRQLNKRIYFITKLMKIFVHPNTPITNLFNGIKCKIISCLLLLFSKCQLLEKVICLGSSQIETDQNFWLEVIITFKLI